MQNSWNERNISVLEKNTSDENKCIIWNET